MKQLIRNLKIAFAVLMVLSIALGAGLVYQQKQSQTTLLAVAGENKASLRQRYSKAGKILSADGIELAYSTPEGERKYAEDPDLQRSVSQLVGDYTHHMSNTIETLYQDELLGNQRNLVEQLLMDFSGRGLQGSNIHLSLNSNLNKLAYELLADYSGTAVLLNYRTGRILAMCSTPAAAMENIIAYEDIPESGLFNRALMGRYAPASTFKIFTTAAWLESPERNPAFTLDSNGEPLRPNGARDRSKNPGHMDLNRAFTLSSNVFFGELAVQVGAKEMIKFLDSTHLQEIDHVDRLNKLPPRWDDSAAEHDKALLSWFGTGQPVGDLVLNFTPVDLALTAGAVANGGNLMRPHVVDKITNPLNQVKEEAKPETAARMFSPQVASRLQQLMLEAVASDETIQSNARIEGYEVGGKSGTLEVESADGIHNNALWTGFVNDQNYPYAACVIVEHVDATNGTAVKMGGRLLEAAIRSVGG